ncbi:PP2C family protein-serine/threonine phosphatase [Actinacidiphila acidipaludis]|uniref:Serine/threonine-protein phosphatase n=1 Tax=Actinacidiphila acidipaludis TaxID=2873382 RepID=A0ABS7QGB0_9ACTN|nr:PP2C family protein-serine/threonine phosphatase [Streptomyces acidipaludis]MBY8882192.1 serine/threonine-protein phosphatase [Streptomyces acidipaludis]
MHARRGQKPSWNPTGSLSRGWMAAAAVFIALVPIADVFLPPSVHIAHALVLPVALTAVFFGPRRTATIAGIAILALVVAAVERMSLSSESVLVELGSLTLLSVLLLLVSRLLERRGHELAGLRHVSEAVLRPLPPRAGPVSIASAYRAADVDTPVGGDLYAVARTKGATRLLIGDVRGKGLGSIGDTEIVLGAFRATAHRPMPLPELVASLEGSVCWGLNEPGGDGPGADVRERFVTAAIVEIPDDEPYVHVVSCGHLPPLRFHDGAVTSLDTPDPAPPLGLGMLAEGGYAASTFAFAPGDRLLLYTDGVTEARDGRGVFYPLLERAAGWGDLGPARLVDTVTADLRRHAVAGLDDDMAVVALRRDESPDPSIPAPHRAAPPAPRPAPATALPNERG